jgi:hypothetical protein
MALGMGTAILTMGTAILTPLAMGTPTLDMAIRTATLPLTAITGAIGRVIATVSVTRAIDLDMEATGVPLSLAEPAAAPLSLAEPTSCITVDGADLKSRLRFL